MGGLFDFALSDESVGESKHVVSLSGEIDAHSAPRLGSRLFGLAEEGKTRVVVDLSEVTFMDSTGIGVLLNALRHFSLRHPTERVLRPFQVTGLVGHLTIFGSREEALAGAAAPG
jgi:anti-sigma B factor antagonist